MPRGGTGRQRRSTPSSVSGAPYPRVAWSIEMADCLSSSDLLAAGALADQALEIALREHNSVSLAFVHMLQTATRYDLGDLVGAEKHFTAGLEFFDDPVFRQSAEAPVMVFGFASFNAWMLGRA